MNVENLIQLLADVKANTQVYFEDDANNLLAISSIALDANNPNDKLVLESTKGRYVLQVWEFVVLLQQYPPKAAIYVHHAKKNHQIFGLRFSDQKLYLK